MVSLKCFGPNVQLILPRLLTAKADDELRMKLLRHGVQDYIHKPFSVEEVLARVGGLLAERRRTGHRLRQSEERFRTLFESITDGFMIGEIVCNDAGQPCDFRYLAVNPAFERQSGLDRAVLIGKTRLELPTEPEPGLLERYAKAALHGEPVYFELLAGATGRHFEGYAFQTEPGRFGAVFTDITERKRAEEALRASEERNRFLADLLGRADQPFGIGYADGRLGYVNSAFECLTGYSRDELQGMDWAAALTPSEWREVERAKLEELHRTGRPVRYEKEYLRKDGTRAPIELLVHLANDDGGRPLYYSFVTDLTERKRAEQALHNQREWLRVTLSSIGDAVLATDGRGTITFFNPIAARLTGWTEEQALGQPAHDVFRIIDEQTHENAEDIIADVLGETRVIPLANHTALVSRDGREIPIEDSAAPIRDSGGNVLGVVLVFHDVTEKRRAQVALQAERERLRMALDASNSGIWEWDVRTNQNFCSDELWRIYGQEPHSRAPSYEGWRRSVMPEDRAMAEQAVQEAARNGAELNVEFRVRGRDGSQRWLMARGQPQRDASGQTTRYIGIAVDITGRKEAEEALRESEARFRRLVKVAPIPLCFVNRDGELNYFNDRFIEVFGYTHDDVPTLKEWWQVAYPDEGYRRWVVGAWEAAVRRAAETNADIEPIEYAVTCKSGKVRQVVISGITIEDNFLATFFDITERKQAEEALRESERKARRSEEHYRLLFETMLQGVVCQDAEGRILSMNRAAESILGKTPAGFLGTTSVDQEHHTIREDGSPFPGLEHPSMIALATGREVRNVRMGVYNPLQEQYRWIDICAVPLFRAGEARPYQVYTLFDDITDRKRAEEAVRQASEQRGLALEAAQMGAWDYHFDTGEVFWDERCANMFGMPAGEIKDSDAIARIRPDDQAPVRQALDQALAGVDGGAYDVEFRVVWPDGSEHWITSHGRVYFIGDGEQRRVVRFIGVNLDITGRKQAERRFREAQKLESLGLLAGGVAHDFNNLLVGVIGNASLAQEMLPAGHAAADLLDGVIKTGEQAAHLTRQMLAYSGKGKFLVEPLNLSTLIPEMSGLVRPSIPKKIALHMNLDPDLPPIEADRGQIQQVFMNLALNAAEAIGSHEGLITVGTGVQDVDERYMRLHPETEALTPGKYVCLEVRDTGSGMDETTKARIFDPFFSTKFTGRGLGLAAVAGILRGHKAAIVVLSAPGEGSCFTVLFPEAEHGAGEVPVPTRAAALRGAGVILLVDDERIVREMAKKALEHQGYTVLPADSGLAAIDVFRRHPGEIALVVLALSMPHMSGEETLPELRKIRPQVKVVVSSGYSESEAMTLFKGQNVSGFIQKPYTASGLAEKVKSTLA